CSLSKGSSHSNPIWLAISLMAFASLTQPRSGFAPGYAAGLTEFKPIVIAIPRRFWVCTAGAWANAKFDAAPLAPMAARPVPLRNSRRRSFMAFSQELWSGCRSAISKPDRGQDFTWFDGVAQTNGKAIPTAQAAGTCGTPTWCRNGSKLNDLRC